MPRCPVFTRAKNKLPYWEYFNNFAVTIAKWIHFYSYDAQLLAKYINSIFETVFFFLILSDFIPNLIPTQHTHTHTHTHIYIYIYIYIVIFRQTVSLYHNSSVWLDTQDASSRDWNPPNFTLDLLLSPQPTHTSSGIITHYILAFVCTPFFVLPDTGVLTSLTDSTKSLDSLSLSVPIIHCIKQIFCAAPGVRTELMYLSLWCTGVSICRSPLENVTWVCLYFFSSTQHILLVLFRRFVRCEAGNRLVAVLWGVASRICSRQLITF